MLYLIVRARYRFRRHVRKARGREIEGRHNAYRKTQRTVGASWAIVKDSDRGSSLELTNHCREARVKRDIIVIAAVCYGRPIFGYIVREL